MRKLLIGAGAVLALLILAALAAPSFIDWNAYRPQLVSAVKDATGRELAIDGGLDLALLPAPELTAKSLRLASVPGAREPDMVRIEELEVRIALLPLLGGEIKVESVRLIEPQIMLEVLADGRNNWTFDAPQERATAGGDASAPDEGGGFALSLDDVEVRDASVTYRNAQTGAEERIAGLSFEGSAASLQGPFALKGELRRDGRPVAFDAAIGALHPGRPTSVRLGLGLNDGEATAEFGGTLSGLGEDARLAGKLKAGAGNLAQALGNDAPLLARPLELEAAIDASASQAAANDLILRFGEVQAGGAVSVAFGPEPRFDATLGATRLDLDALLKAADAAPAAKATRAGPGAKPQEAGGGLVLPAGLSGALNLSVDGVVYRDAVIRQAQLSAELADGKLAVKRLGALLPGGSDATVSGALTTPGGKPQFDGRLELASDNLRGLLSWLRLEPSGVPVGRLNTASLTTALRMTPGLAEFANVKLRLDGSTVTGGAAYRLQERPSFAVDVAVDRLNLDGYLAEPEPGAAAARNERQNKPAPQRGALAALNDFDANVKVRVGQLVYNRAPLTNVLFDGTLVGGRLTLRQARAQDQAGAAISASGSASDFAATPKFQAELALAADDLSGLAQLAGLRTTGGVAKIGRTDLKALLDGSVEALTFAVEGALAGGSLKADGEASGLQATPTFDAKVEAEHADVVALVRNFGVDWRPAAAKLGGLSVALAAKGTAAALELPTLKVKAGPASLEGSAKVKFDGARPYLNAKLDAGEIVLDLFLPASGGERPARAVEGAAPSRPAEPHWSREPLDLSPLQGFDADVELAARGITFRDYPFQEPRLALALKDGTLRIGELTGKLFQGAVALKGELASAPQPTLALDVKLAGADIHQALVTAMGLDKVSGRLDFTGAFRAAGRSEWELVNSLSGDAKLDGGDGALRGVDLPSLSRRLAELNGPAAFLDLATRSFSGGETAIRSVSGSWQVKGGVATTQDTRATLDAAEATLIGDVNLAAWRMDLRSEVALTEHPKAPPLAVTLRGPLDNPQRDVKTQAMEQYLAARIGSELLEKGLGDKVKELAPLGELLGGGARRQQPAPGQPQQEPAAPPAQQAIEGLLKGLLKK